MTRQRDYPFYEIADAVNDWALRGAKCYQKFTCEHCKQRLTMEQPNVLYKKGTCDKCGKTTDIEKNGCNFRLEVVIILPGG